MLNPTAGYSASEEKQEIWVYLEPGEDALSSVSLELLGKARLLADTAGYEVKGLMVGYGLLELAEDAISCGADAVLLVEDQRLTQFNVEAFTAVVTQAVLEGRPSIFLVGATHDGRDLAGRLAVRMQTGLNADCTDLALDPDRGILVSEVTGFGGGIIALLECPKQRPQMSTVRPGVFPLPIHDPKRKGEISPLKIDLPDTCFQTSVLKKEEYDLVDLTQADVLICGGRGVEGNFDSLFALAQDLSAEVGATRPPVDDGFIARERQVGQTGVVCRPKIAICLGISGAFHFIVGIEKADIVIAVNSDREAPIFDYADYGIVADVAEFVPALNRALLERKEHSRV